MKLNIKESLSQVDIHDEKSFSVLGGTAYCYTTNGANAWGHPLRLDAKGYYTSLTELLISLTGKLDGELPIRLEDFDNITFSITSSILRLYFTTKAGEHKVLSLTIYQNACWPGRRDACDFVGGAVEISD